MSTVRSLTVYPSSTSSATLMADEESIYNIIPKPVVAPPKPPLYKSIHPGKVDAPRRKGATMGEARSKPPNPHNFLRAHEKEPRAAPPACEKERVSAYKDSTGRKAPVPKRGEGPIQGLQAEKDFVLANKLEAMLAEPPRSQAEADWTKKPEYGQRPAYLDSVAKEIREERDYLQKIEEQRRQTDEQPSREKVSVLAEEERQEILSGLVEAKTKLEEEYSRLPLNTDTAYLRRRKEALETELDVVEANIERMSKPVVLVREEK